MPEVPYRACQISPRGPITGVEGGRSVAPVPLPAIPADGTIRTGLRDAGMSPWRRPREYANMRFNMARYLTISAALCVFLAPILCMSGVLDHHCDCDAEMVCGHEADCAADPCRAFVAARFSSRSTSLVAQDSFPLPSFAASLCAVLPAHAMVPLRHCADEQTAHACRLPFPRSDVPLLL